MRLFNNKNNQFYSRGAACKWTNCQQETVTIETIWVTNPILNVTNVTFRLAKVTNLHHRLYHVQMSSCVSFYILISLSALRSLSPSVSLCATHIPHTYTHTQAHAQRMHAQAHAPNATFMCVTAPGIGTGAWWDGTCVASLVPSCHNVGRTSMACDERLIWALIGHRLAGSGVFDNLSLL